MGADSSKENSRKNTPTRSPQYVNEELPAVPDTYRQRTSAVRTSPSHQPHNSPANPVKPAQQPTVLERTRSPYSYTTQDIANKQRTQSLFNTTTTTQQTQHLERLRQPYNLNTQDLQNGAQKSQNLYPNLNQQRSEEGFVVINNYGHQRAAAPVPAPSAPPAETTFPGRATPTPKHAGYSGNHNAAGSTSSANSSTNKNRQGPAARAHANRDSLTCPTCSQRLGVTIYQCSGGHSSCNNCRTAQRSCGTCMSPITDMRNIMLEAYIAELRTPCPSQGCTLSFNAVEMDRHLKECPFGEMDCPMGTFFGQCSYRCKVSDLASHFDEYHREQRTAEIDKEMYVFNICMETHEMFLIKNGPYTFLLHFKVAENQRKIFMTVQLLGSRISAEKWFYEFHVYNKRQPLRKFLYSDSCQSIGKPVDDIFIENQCASLPLSYAMTFVNESTLTYKFYIKRNTKQRPRKGPKNAANTEN